MSPGKGGNCNGGVPGVPTDSAQSRSEGMGTVGTGEAAGAGVEAADGAGRGRGSRGGGISMPGR